MRYFHEIYAVNENKVDRLMDFFTKKDNFEVTIYNFTV